MEGLAPLTIAASMGLSSLQHEPQRLKAEAEKLNLELESLVMDNYKIFVENLTCSAILRSEDKNIAESSTEMSESLHGLAQQCLAFKDRVSHFVEHHKRNRKTLQHHMQLVELLEVPQLVDACSRNGFHDEALELANFVNGLERRHLLAAEVRSLDGKVRGGSGVVQSIVDEVHSSLLTLRGQLIHQLTETASLPKEMQILATLRKLDGILIDRKMSQERYANELLAHASDAQREQLRRHLFVQAETRLQLDFLEARTMWLRRVAEKAVHGLGPSGENGSGRYDATGSFSPHLLEAEGGGAALGGQQHLGPYGKAIELLEVSRTSWFSVVTQFKALFDDSVPRASSTSAPSQQAYHVSADAVLGAWASKQVHLLLTELQALLPLIEEGTSLRTVLEQALYFACRMGEAGCDFSGLLLPLFKDALHARVVRDLRVASSNFKSMMKTEKFVIEVDDSVREQMVPLFLSQEKVLDDSSASFSLNKNRASAEDFAAPLGIMAYPPLAYLLNAVLTCLNYLRECPLTVARDVVLAEIADLLQDTSEYIVQSAGELRVRGGRYVDAVETHGSQGSQGSSLRKIRAKRTAGDGLGDGSEEVSDADLVCLDKRYAVAFAQETAPHILQCLDLIFPLKAQTVSSPHPLSSGRDRTALIDFKGILSSDSFATLENVWKPLKKSSLL